MPKFENGKKISESMSRQSGTISFNSRESILEIQSVKHALIVLDWTLSNG
jgi:hypothetical protein